MTWATDWRWGAMLATAVLLLLSWVHVSQVFEQPIEHVAVAASFERLSQQQVQSVIDQQLVGGFFSVNVQGLQQHLLALPWVAQVSIRRVWPDRLMIQLEERQAVARWGADQALDGQGEVFSPNAESMTGEWVQLAGPEGSNQEVLRLYQGFAAEAALAELMVTRLQKSPRGAWQLALNNGLEVMLGKQQPLQRFARFMRIYQQHLAPLVAHMQRVDLRYSHGIAVRWRESKVQS